MRFESSGHSAPSPGLFGRTRSGSYFEGNINIHKWKLALAVLAIALFAAWYAFRPERSVINHRVNEAFLGAKTLHPPKSSSPALSMQ